MVETARRSSIRSAASAAAIPPVAADAAPATFIAWTAAISIGVGIVSRATEYAVAAILATAETWAALGAVAVNHCAADVSEARDLSLALPLQPASS
ncbi:hypothetical protein GCM10011410_16520 [Hoyosella rhizosphaerae]|uniref:Uncharacterized protein n=1 Tax=Hoyosella rhizosphaerae TaxID=1755582 RepID=A0A916XDW3_9ACTN|nr:hypothetical protein GCM10011410_16520 [Hoyosella rhizosphaerae]